MVFVMLRASFSGLLLISVMALAGCLSSEDNTASLEQPDLIRPAKIAKASASGFSAKRVFPSTVEASKHSDLAFRVSGQLQELLVQSGSEVKKGQVLAKLDQSDYRNALSDRQARYDLAKVQYDQIESLIEKKYASKTRLDEARANLKAARAALSVARDNLSYTILKAPYDGVIARVDIENFQPVQAQKTIFRLQDSTNIDIRFSVPETIVSRLNPEADATKLCGQVRLESWPDQSFRACYRKHESIPDAVTRTYRVTFTMPREPEFAILPGMSVNLEVDLTDALHNSESSERVSLPLESVFDREGVSHVWLLDSDMKARLKSVEAVQIRSDQIEVKGLQEGDLVIAAGVDFVVEGQKVRPMVKERGL